MTLDCNHDCKNCPAWTVSGQTSCLIINRVLIKLEYETKTAKQLLRNAEKEGETND